MLSIPSAGPIWLLFTATVTSAPSTRKHAMFLRTPDVRDGETDVGQQGVGDFGEFVASHAGYTVVSLLCMTILGGLVGYRVRQIDRRKLKDLCFTHVLICLLYLLSLCFVFSAAVIESGLGLASLGVCRGAIYLCLGFYIASKVVMYLFLIERAHALRPPFMRRTRDWLWIIGTTLILSGFGGIGVVAFVNPVADMSPIDGRCRIGIPRYVTIPLVSYDVAINILLTLALVYLLSPLIRPGTLPTAAFPATRLAKCFSSICRQSKQRSSLLSATAGNQHAVKRLERLLWKTFVGSVLVMIPTVGNFAALSAVGGRELGWICLTTCTFDVVWTVAVLHWLTVGANETVKRQANE